MAQKLEDFKIYLSRCREALNYVGILKSSDAGFVTTATATESLAPFCGWQPGPNNMIPVLSYFQ